MATPVLTQLVIYPVKGCRGISLRRCALTSAGLALDREWMVVAETGSFVTQVRAQHVRGSPLSPALIRSNRVSSGKRASWRLWCRRCRRRRTWRLGAAAAAPRELPL